MNRTFVMNNVGEDIVQSIMKITKPCSTLSCPEESVVGVSMTITLFFLTLTAFNWAAATTQLIQNGGFEDGTTGWETMGRADFRGRQPYIIKCVMNSL